MSQVGMSDETGVDPDLAESLGLSSPAPQRPRARDAKGRFFPVGSDPSEAAPETRRPATETRGRPAQLEATAEDGYEDDGLTRRSLDEADGNTFEVPRHLERRGWAYQWFTVTVMGQPTDGAEMGFAYRQGWRPCVDQQIREHFMPPTWEKSTIEQRGMLLMTRPKRLQDEAAREMRQKADDQKMQKLRAALAAPAEQSPLMPRSVSLSMEGEIGAYADDPRKERA